MRQQAPDSWILGGPAGAGRCRPAHLRGDPVGHDAHWGQKSLGQQPPTRCIRCDSSNHR